MRNKNREKMSVNGEIYINILLSNKESSFNHYEVTNTYGQSYQVYLKAFGLYWVLDLIIPTVYGHLIHVN